MTKVFKTVYALKRIKVCEPGFLYIVTDLNAFGFWILDVTDTTSADDGVNCIINGSGQRLKRQILLQALAAPALTLESNAIGTEVTASWSPRLTSGGYILEFSTDNISFTAIGGTISAATPTYTHTGRTNNTLYYYRVKALAAAGYQESGWGTASITTFTGTNLLDGTNAAAAYSVSRKLRSTWSGSCIRVRRSSDSTEQDIGFSGNNLDTAALIAFAGSGDATVVSIYDQTGNSRHGTVAAPTNAPKIVVAGSLLTEGSKPCMEFDGTDDYFDVPDFNLGSTFFIFSVAGKVTTNAANAIFARGTTGGGYSRDVMLFLDTTTDLLNTQRIDGSNVRMADKAANLAAMQLHAGSLHADELTASVNNSAGTPTSSTISGSIGPQCSIGAIGDGATMKAFFKGRIQELVVYTTNQSSNLTTISNNINTHYTLY